MQKTIKALPWIQRSMIFAACLFGLAAGSAHAYERSVTTLNDSGDGSLRQAIADAAGGDTITFNVNGTFRLTSGPLVIDNRDLDIVGPGAKRLTMSGNHASRVFVIQNTPTNTDVTLAGIAISNGQGGGLFEDALRSVPPLPGPDTPSSLILDEAIIRFNLALVGEAVDSGFDGTGVGGGVYYFGTYNAVFGESIRGVFEMLSTF